jgi:thiol-disulfide isomerase/thioredoxin
MARTPSTMLALGTPFIPFRLTDGISNDIVSFAPPFKNPVLVAFICNHCPFVKHLFVGLTAFISDFSTQIDIVFINSNDVENYPEDRPELMAALKKELGWNIPYLFDQSQEIAKAYHAACTPDFYFFNRDGILVYRGQFDESRPGNGIPVTGTDLRAAVNAVLEGKSVSENQRPSLGCNIKWRNS